MKKKFTAIMVLFVVLFSATLPYFAAENTEDNYSNVIYDEDGNKMESIKYHGHVSSHGKRFENHYRPISLYEKSSKNLSHIKTSLSLIVETVEQMEKGQ